MLGAANVTRAPRRSSATRMLTASVISVPSRNPQPLKMTATRDDINLRDLRAREVYARDVDEAGVQIAPGIRVPESALRFQFSRGSGPGGQNVNKVNTRAELWVQLESLAAAGMTHRAIGRLKTLA